MKSFFIIFYLIICDQAYTQGLTKGKITGEWICKEVSINSDKVTPDRRAAAEMMKNGFLNSKFIFGSNGIFSLQLPKESPAVMKEFNFLNKKQWFLDQKNHFITIGTSKENLMKIQINEADGFLIFMLEETPFVLRMEKI